MSKQFDTLVFITRCSPFHEGHYYVIRRALEMADKVIILIGGSNRPRDIRSPFTYEERRDMITRSVTPSELEHIQISSLYEYMYDEQAWVDEVQFKIGYLTQHQTTPKIGIIGYAKDKTSGYFKLFPHWQFINVECFKHINATEIRFFLFDNPTYDPHFELVTTRQVSDFLLKFKTTAEYVELCNEWQAIQTYKQSWRLAPYAPTFITADAMVICMNHVLMIQRKRAPGKGLWAMPGGFVNQDEFIECAAIRELKEETQIGVSSDVLRKNIRASHQFDHPLRDHRGRMVTTTYKIQLSNTSLPVIIPSDDAMDAKWIPISDIDSTVCYADHYDMIAYMQKYYF